MLTYKFLSRSRQTESQSVFFISWRNVVYDLKFQHHSMIFILREVFTSIFLFFFNSWQDDSKETEFKVSVFLLSPSFKANVIYSPGKIKGEIVLCRERAESEEQPKLAESWLWNDITQRRHAVHNTTHAQAATTTKTLCCFFSDESGNCPIYLGNSGFGSDALYLGMWRKSVFQCKLDNVFLDVLPFFFWHEEKHCIPM